MHVCGTPDDEEKSFSHSLEKATSLQQCNINLKPIVFHNIYIYNVILKKKKCAKGTEHS